MRLAGGLLAFFATIAGLALVVSHIAAPPPLLQSDTGRLFEQMVARMRQERPAFERQMVMLGDSMLMPAPGKHGPKDAAVPRRLERTLQLLVGERPRLRVYPFAQPGASYSMFYFLSDALARAQPDVVALSVNLPSLSRHWRTGPWVRTDLAAWLDPSRLGQALALPLNRLGLTADRLLALTACNVLGLRPAWGDIQRMQVRTQASYKQLRLSLARPLADARGRALWRSRLSGTQHGFRFRNGGYGHTKDAMRGMARGDVAFALIEASVRHLTQRGIRTLVYLTPVNVEHMRKLDAYDPAGVAVIARHLGAATRAAGGEFLDLHDLLDDSGFRDAAGHLSFHGKTSGMNRVVHALARQLMKPPPHAATTAPGH